MYKDMEDTLLQKFLSGFIGSKWSLSAKIILTLALGAVLAVFLVFFLEGVFGVSPKETDSLGSQVMGVSFLYVCWMVFLHSAWKWINASDRTRVFIKSLCLASIVGLVSYFLAGIGVAIIAFLICVIGGMLFLKS